MATNVPKLTYSIPEACEALGCLNLSKNASIPVLILVIGVVGQRRLNQILFKILLNPGLQTPL